MNEDSPKPTHSAAAEVVDRGSLGLEAGSSRWRLRQEGANGAHNCCLRGPQVPLRWAFGFRVWRNCVEKRKNMWWGCSATKSRRGSTHQRHDKYPNIRAMTSQQMEDGKLFGATLTQLRRFTYETHATRLLIGMQTESGKLAKSGRTFSTCLNCANLSN